MNLHETIYQLRTARNMSQLELAEALDVSRQSISKWETGTAVPELDKLVKLSDVFGITLDELVRGTGEGDAAETGITEPKPESVPTETRHRMKRYQIIALALLCASLVLTVLLAGFGDDRTALTVGPPLAAICAVFLILPRRHWLWGFWGVWFAVFMVMQTLIGGFFFIGPQSLPFLRCLSWLMIASFILLCIFTARRLKK